MTEAEWLACDDPQEMLEFLRERGKVSDRKLRLLVCAWCHRVFSMGAWEELSDAVAIGDLHADQRATEAELRDARSWVGWGISEMCESLNLRAEALALAFQEQPLSVADVERAAQQMLVGWQMNVPDLDVDVERAIQSQSIREFFNPFHPVTLGPSWITATITDLAGSIYSDRCFDLLLLLADALEEAGCTDADILGHCRGPGPHVRGCWVVDAVLGKS